MGYSHPVRHTYLCRDFPNVLPIRVQHAWARVDSMKELCVFSCLFDEYGVAGARSMLVDWIFWWKCCLKWDTYPSSSVVSMMPSRRKLVGGPCVEMLSIVFSLDDVLYSLTIESFFGSWGVSDNAC